MKQLLYTLILLCIGTYTAVAQVISPDCPPDKIEPGSWYCFRNTVNLKRQPRNVSLHIAADSKYWLWVNGELQVREGGLKRGPNPNDTYCDTIGSLPALKKGQNTITLLVWYFGKDGFSHRNSPTPGMTFALNVDGKDIRPRKPWKSIAHPAFYQPEGEQPNYRLPESNIGFDAGKDIDFTRPDFDDSQWPDARLTDLAAAGWNKLQPRPIPQWKDYGLKPYERTERINDTILHAYLPYNAQITPYIRLRADKDRKVRIRTDNYTGGSANNVFAEYTTRQGEQDFECLGWMNGHYVVYQVPKDAEVLDLMYRETGYDTYFAGSFYCDDPALNRLWEKSQRTLYITMRDTYMDCPDRERAQWWGDVVNELGEAFYALDEKAHLLTRKGIRELMDWQRADSTIFAPVPAGNYDSELPMQMLASVGYYGFWTYYMGTADSATIGYVYPNVKKYIHVWKTDAQGLAIPRKGGWTWGDWGENKDMELLFSQWYIIALQGYKRMARLTGDTAEADWAQATADRARTAFHQKYWNGSYYVSPSHQGLPDDRPQALAVVSGTLPDTLYPALRPFFGQQYHASPYMEKYVLQALCLMGYHQDALNRMKLRYRAMTDSPLTVMSQYIAGIEPTAPAFRRFRVSPHPAHLNQIRAVVPLSGKREIRLSLDKDSRRCDIVLEVPQGTEACFCLPDGYTGMSVNGTVCQSAEKVLTPGVWNIRLMQAGDYASK